VPLAIQSIRNLRRLGRSGEQAFGAMHLAQRSDKEMAFRLTTLFVTVFIFAIVCNWFRIEWEYEAAKKSIAELRLVRSLTAEQQDQTRRLIESHPRLARDTQACLWGAESLDYDLNQLLINNGADVNDQSLMGIGPPTVVVPLFYCIARKRADLCQLYLQAGADPDFLLTMEPGPKLPLLHWACEVGDVQIVDLLIQHGADVQVQDEYGRSCLFVALQERNIPLARFLLEHGVDPSLQRRDGKTALHVLQDRMKLQEGDGESSDREDEEMLKLLEQMSAQ